MLERLLSRTSRTFALAIPLLPDPPRQEVSIAYLLFRIADTLEDASNWPRARRTSALSGFEALLRAPDRAEAGRLAADWLSDAPCQDAGYLELLRETPAVIAALEQLTAERRRLVVRHALRTVEGMASFVAASDERGVLILESEQDLRRYCYVVAGIVGELLTELFLEVAPELACAELALKTNAPAFGEGLQLVNILKDSDADARDGRRYVPSALGAARVRALARADLDAGDRYVDALRAASAPPGMVAFCAFPAALARLTLDEIERVGPGAKVGREAVMRLLEQLSAPAESSHGKRAAGAS